MLPFFRKVRFQTANDNQLFKYGRYAVGEIVLVVVGILIALQINNWNENRKERILELQLLRAFERGLEKDLSDIDLNVAIHQAGIDAAERVLVVLEDGDPKDRDSVPELMSRVFLPSVFVYSTSAFETLKSKGVTLISNDVLRDGIIEVYDSRYRFFLDNELVHRQTLEGLLSGTFATRFEESYVHDLNTPNFKGALTPIDLENLGNDQEFIYQFKSFRNRLIVLVDWHYGQLRSRIVDLRQAILEEIDKLENK